MTPPLPRPLVDIAIESPLWAALADAETIVQSALGAALAASGAALAPETEVSVVLADDAFVADLNGRWRGQAKPTNVLSFPANHPTGAVLGDIVIAYETTAREAAAEGKTLAAHLTHLVVHGVLHLIGLDHMTEADAEEMEGVERAVLATLGIADPYAEGASEPR